MRLDIYKTDMAKFQDEFDVYFARAKLDEELAKEKELTEEQQAPPQNNERRGSLPGATITLEVPTSHRRALSCKLPSRKKSKKNKKGSNSPQNHSPPSGTNQGSSPPPQQQPPQRSSSGANMHTEDSAASLELPGVSMNYITEPTLRAPSPRIDASKSHSAPHSRSSSWKNKRRPRSGMFNNDSPEDDSPENQISRHSSITRFEEDVATKLEELKVLQSENALVVRNFSLSSKGVINRGDSFKRKPRNSNTSNPEVSQDQVVNSQEVATGITEQHPLLAAGDVTVASPGVVVAPTVQRVLVIGDRGVGKTALLQQFMTSQYMGAAETNFDDECGKMVTVMVNGEETTIDFIDVPVESDLSMYGRVDGYLLVFSITSKPSYYYVKDVLENLCFDVDTRHVAKILVANKGDLVRKRSVSENDPRTTCQRYGCKYSEVSAVLNHKLDELLVGLVTQMRLNREREMKFKDNEQDFPRNVSCVSAKSLMQLLFKKKQQTSKSCDNLLAL